jgi:hypothetical protein
VVREMVVLAVGRVMMMALWGGALIPRLRASKGVRSKQALAVPITCNNYSPLLEEYVDLHEHNQHSYSITFMGSSESR